jgi:hypothetical protein
MGEYCSLDDKQKVNTGFTWMHGNQIQYGGGNNDKTPSFLFRFTSTPFYVDAKAGESTRLFIKDTESKKICFQIFEKNAAGKSTDPSLYNVDEVDKFNRFWRRDQLNKELNSPWSFDNLPVSDEIEKIKPRFAN